MFVERVSENTGEESLYKKIVAYASSTASRISHYKPETDASGQPVWAILYTFLRGGLRSELLKYCSANKACQEISRYLNEYFYSSETALGIHSQLYESRLRIYFSEAQFQIDKEHCSALKNYFPSQL